MNSISIIDRQMKGKPKIVHILEATLGGTSKHVCDLVDGIDRSKFSVSLIYSMDRADSIFGSRLTDLASIGTTLVELSMKRDISPLNDLISLFRVIRCLKKENPDILHLHGAKAGALGRLAAVILGIKLVIYNPHGGSFHLIADRASRFPRLVERMLAFSTTSYIAVSEFARRQIKESTGVNSSRIRVIYNGIDSIQHKVETTDSSILFSGFEIPKEAFLVLYPALFMEAKGHLDFLESIRRSGKRFERNVIVLLAGFGPLEDKIESQISELRLKEHFRLIGFRRDLPVWYSLCDLVILPSRNEVFGYVLLEAMCYAKPVLATNAGSIPEIIQHGQNGELVDLNDLSQLVDRINFYSNNRRLLFEMGRRAHDIALTCFSKEKMLKATENLYQELLSSNV